MWTQSEMKIKNSIMDRSIWPCRTMKWILAIFVIQLIDLSVNRKYLFLFLILRGFPKCTSSVFGCRSSKFGIERVNDSSQINTSARCNWWDFYYSTESVETSPAFFRKGEWTFVRKKIHANEATTVAMTFQLKKSWGSEEHKLCFRQ